MRNFVEIEDAALREALPSSFSPAPCVKIPCGVGQIGFDRFKYLFTTVLQIVHQHGESDLSKSVFPDWFTSQFSEEMTPEQANQWLVRWQKMTDTERAEDEARRGWSFDNWLYWLHEDQRTWWYVGLEEKASDELNVVVLSHEGAAFGALYWLIKCCGGLIVEHP